MQAYCLKLGILPALPVGFTGKMECQMVIHTVDKTKHERSDVIGNDWGKSRGLFLFG